MTRKRQINKEKSKNQNNSNNVIVPVVGTIINSNNNNNEVITTSQMELGVDTTNETPEVITLGTYQLSRSVLKGRSAAKNVFNEFLELYKAELKQNDEQDDLIWNVIQLIISASIV